MNCDEPPASDRRSLAIAVLLFVAMLLCGVMLAWLPPVTLDIVARRRANPLSTPGFLAVALGVFALLGTVAAVGLTRVRQWHALGGLLALALFGVAALVRFALIGAAQNANVSSELAFAASSAALALVMATAVSFAAWLGRSGRIDPFAMFGFVFLGVLGGFVAMDGHDNRIVDRATGGLTIMGFVFLGVARLAMKDEPDGRAREAAPSWARRFRWFLLGGLPAIATIGCISYVAANLAVMPIIFFLPVSWLVTWAVAFSRKETPTSKAGWTVQSLAILACLGFVTYGIIEGETRQWSAATWACGIAAVMTLFAIAFAPQRVTFVVQCVFSLASIALVLVVPPERIESFGATIVVVVHVLSVVASCRGCHGDAVLDAPPDRIAEFACCIFVGTFVGVVAFSVLISTPFRSHGAGDYVGPIVACLLVRVSARFARTSVSTGA